jgi:predicted amidophosphoribosyltransferase
MTIGLSDHQSSACYKCADDASKYNHCSMCGYDADSPESLGRHLDAGCLEKIMQYMRSQFGIS